LLAAHYLKLTADQRNADAQINCAILLNKGDDIPINESLAVHSFKLIADQRNAFAQINCATLVEAT
jgi:TPR repeat protein